MFKILLACAVTVVLLGALGPESGASPLTSEFTYQGQLSLNGSPYQGNAGFRFKLFDALTAGNQIGTTQSLAPVPVDGGIFTVVLNFGVPAFDGDARWMEIEVSTDMGVNWEVLSPRQALTASPYSLQTRGIYVGSSGDVGIGTTTPAAKLHIAKSGSALSLRVESQTNHSTGLELANPNHEFEMRVTSGGNLRLDDVTDGGTARLFVAGGGNIGIGTTSPSAPLHVVGGAVDNAMIVESSSATVTRFRIKNSGAGGKEYDLISTADGSGIGGGKFAIRDNATGDARLQIDAAGHVGINTSPSATNMLDVAGNVECSVIQINGGSDIAEPFVMASGETVLPGMVVSIDPERPAGLRLATTAYDRTVAGVVSGAGGVNPGMTLRHEGTAADGTHPVALTGRVYCYVDADAGGPVRPGDLLTTSDTPGHAMRVEDHDRAAGAILGKAMTSLESGRGLVLVLVSLQ